MPSMRKTVEARLARRVGVALLAALGVAGALAVPAQAEFGLDGAPRVTWHQPLDISYFESVSLDPDTFAYPSRGVLVPPLTEDTRAGAHPDLSVDLAFNVHPSGNPLNPDEVVPDAPLRDVEVDLPAGFVGDPTNYPTCDPARLADNSGYGCDPGSQIGVVGLGFPDNGFTYPIFNMKTGADAPAQFAFQLGRRVTVEVGPRTESDYGLRARVTNIPETIPVNEIRMTFWGNPSDPVHDRLRRKPNGDLGFDENGVNVGVPSEFPPLPFLSAPARCDAPLSSEVRITSWRGSGTPLIYRPQAAQRTDCDALSFDAGLRATPSTVAAGQPTGMGIDLDVPQTNSMDQLATPQVKDVAVTLPEGVAISPGGADGLQACSDAQLVTDSRAPETCPEASRVGSTTITTPLLEEPLSGSVYLGTQLSQDPASGDMYRLFVTAYAKGVRIKLKGNVAADPVTGRLTATFRQNPQLPFSTLRLDLKDGPRALLTNPTSCGTGKVKLDASSYAGTSVSRESDYVVASNCPTGAFAPVFNAGTLDPFAGRLSPFTMTVSRPDGQQDLSSLKLDLPSGLLGALGSVPVCGDAQAAAGTCDAASRLGSTTVSVGTGSAPFSLPGTVSLAGPYKGAPFSLSIAVPAKAGPLDLGLVVVRSPLVIDANTAKVSAPVDGLPQIVGGVPLHYRTITVTLDRPGFMFNATNCSAQQIGASLSSTGGTAVAPAVRYQPQSCDRLKLKPTLKLTYSGKSDLKKGRNTKLTADLGQTFGQAGLKQVAVTLPLISALEPDNAETLCSVAQAAARDCPAGSIVGRASALTPALPERLTGPVYLLQGVRTTASGKTVRTLPKLWLKLSGSGVPLDLRADTGVDGQQRLVTTFTQIPDAPISNFKLEIDGGKKGILAAVEDPCQPTRRALAAFSGQNGARVNRSLQIAAPACAIRASTKAGKSAVTVSLANLKPGRVTVSGPGVERAAKTLRTGDSTTVTARLTKTTRRRLARRGTVSVTLEVVVNPSGKGKTRTLTRTVRIGGRRS